MRNPPRLIRSIKRATDRLFHAVYRRAFDIRRREPTKTVLLVRTDGIGDFVYFTRYLKAICDRYRGFRIVLCCRVETAPLAEAIRLIDEVIPFKSVRCRRNYFYRLYILNRIRTVHPQVAVYLSFHREHIGDEMTLFSGAPETVGFSGNDEIIHPSMRRRNNLEYSRVVEVPDHVPEKDKYEQMLSSLGCSLSEISDDTFLAHHLVMPELNDAKRLPITIAQGRYLFIAPGGSGPIRRWPAHKFSALADHLASEFHLPIVLCGNREEHVILLEIQRTMKSRAEICTSLDLLQVIVLMKMASAFVGNESGLLHLAASLNIPAVGILGGGHFNRYFPYGSVQLVINKLDCYECNWSCRYPEPYCLTNITVDDVFRAVKNLDLL